MLSKVASRTRLRGTPIFFGSSRKWSDSTWTHGKQLEQLLQQVTTLRGDIASSRPMLTKGCCKGNNYEQRFALDTFPANCSGIMS